MVLDGSHIGFRVWGLTCFAFRTKNNLKQTKVWLTVLTQALTSWTQKVCVVHSHHNTKPNLLNTQACPACSIQFTKTHFHPMWFIPISLASSTLDGTNWSLLLVIVLDTLSYTVSLDTNICWIQLYLSSVLTFCSTSLDTMYPCNIHTSIQMMDRATLQLVQVQEFLSNL